ncbi:TPT-domain-containing protein, partial [Neocallimastix californiae]
YTLSICLSVFNKWFFGKPHFKFPYSLFTTFIHSCVQFLGSVVTLFFFPKYKSTNKLSLKNFFAATGLDIGLSNTSLKNITLTFYTMIKSSTPVFVLSFAFLFGLEKPSVKLIGIIIIIVFGVFIMVMEETEFNLFGFLEVVIATVLGGLRWSMTQILLQKESLGLTNPIITNFYLTPVMAFTILIFSAIHEGIGNILKSTFFNSFGSAIQTFGYMTFGGSIAYLMIIAEYNIIMNTGVVTLSVAGIFKEIIVLVCSHFIFHDTFTTQAVIGLFISLVGIGLYNYHKIKLVQQKEYIAYEHTILCDGEIDFFVLDDEDGNKLYELTNANTKLNKDIERSNVKSLNYAPRDKKQKVIFDSETVDIKNNSSNVIGSTSS